MDGEGFLFQPFHGLQQRRTSHPAVKGFSKHPVMYRIIFEGNIRHGGFADADMIVGDGVFIGFGSHIDDIRIDGGEAGFFFFLAHKMGRFGGDDAGNGLDQCHHVEQFLAGYEFVLSAEGFFDDRQNRISAADHQCRDFSERVKQKPEPFSVTALIFL